jgi:hypothetical protein
MAGVQPRFVRTLTRGPRRGVKDFSNLCELHEFCPHIYIPQKTIDGRSFWCLRRRIVGVLVWIGKNLLQAMSTTVRINFCATHKDDFPCNLSEIAAVSLGLAAGGASLLFVAFLYRQVRL